MISQRFDWPGLCQDVIDWVASCPTCQSLKGPVPGFRWKLRNIQVTRQNQVVQINFEILPKTKNGYQYILMIIDHFSKFAQAHAVKDMNAAKVAGIIWSKRISYCGPMEYLQSDRGTEFEAECFNRWAKQMQMTKIRATAYPPQSTGLFERQNRPLINIIPTYAYAHENMGEVP